MVIYSINEDVSHLPISYQVKENDVRIYMEPTNGMKIGNKEYSKVGLFVIEM